MQAEPVLTHRVQVRLSNLSMLRRPRTYSMSPTIVGYRSTRLGGRDKRLSVIELDQIDEMKDSWFHIQ